MSKPLSIDHKQVAISDDGLRTSPYNMAMPYVRYNKQGTRILILIDHPPQADIKSGVLGSGVSGDVLNNVIEYAQRDSEGKLGELFFANFYDVAPNSGDPRIVLERSLHRLQHITDNFRPDVIISFGEYSSRVLGWNNQRENLLKKGRIRDCQINGKAYHGIDSFPYLFWAGAPPDASFSFIHASLISLVLEHVSLAIAGDNRYTLPNKPRHFIIDTMAQWRQFYQQLLHAETPSIDTETQNLNRIANKLLTVQFCLDGRDCHLLPWLHKESPWQETERRIIRQNLWNYFTKNNAKWHIYQNAKFDLTQFKVQLDIPYFCNKLWDCAAGEFALNENNKWFAMAYEEQFRRYKFGPYSLLRQEHKYGLTRPSNLLSKEERANMANEPLARIAEYGSYDVMAPWHISRFQQKEAQRRGKHYRGYEQCVTVTISDIIHTFVEMESHGVLIDRDYLQKMMRPDSIFLKTIKEINQSFRQSGNAHKANSKLLSKNDLPQVNLLGQRSAWVLDMNRPAHRETLFFDIMKLAPVSYSLKTGKPQTDKVFKDKYIKVPEVQRYALLMHYEHMFDAFIAGVWRQLLKQADAMDGRLRSTYGYLYIITGRTNCVAPNYQQIPTRSQKFDDVEPALAKWIKRQFIAKSGCLFIKADFSAHEIRGWGQCSRDPKIAEVFWIAWEARRKYRIARSKEDIEFYAKELEYKSDIHLSNVKFFYNLDVDKKHPLRQSIKQVVFGVIYDLTAKGLAPRINNTVQEAQKLINMLFSRWFVGAKFLKDVKAFAREHLRVLSPLGRVRHLPGFIHWHEAFQAAMERRGPNSIIQGAASDLGYKTARLIRKMVWHIFENSHIFLKMRQLNAVHDSGLHEVPVLEIPLAIYLIEHAATTQLQKFCRLDHNFINAIPYDIDIEIGGSEGALHSFDLRWDNLYDIIEKSLEWQSKELHYQTDKNTLMSLLRHNITIVGNIRDRELAMINQKNGPAEFCAILDNPNLLHNYIYDLPKMLQQAAE